MLRRPALVPILSHGRGDGRPNDENTAAAASAAAADACAASRSICDDAARQQAHRDDGNKNKQQQHQKKNERGSKYRPFIPLYADGSSSATPSLGAAAVTFGRTEILTSTYASCGCIQRRPSQEPSLLPSDKARAATIANNTKSKKRGHITLCHHCREAERWAVRFLSRQMVRLTPIPLSQYHQSEDEAREGKRVEEGEGVHQSPMRFRVQIRGENASKFVLVDDTPPNIAMKAADCNGWMVGEQLLGVGSIIAFRYPEEDGKRRSGGDLDVEDGGEGRSGKILKFQLCLLSESDTSSVEKISKGSVGDTQYSKKGGEVKVSRPAEDVVGTKNHTSSIAKNSKKVTDDDNAASTSGEILEKVDTANSQKSSSIEAKPLAEGSFFFCGGLLGAEEQIITRQESAAPNVERNGSCSPKDHASSFSTISSKSHAAAREGSQQQAEAVPTTVASAACDASHVSVLPNPLQQQQQQHQQQQANGSQSTDEVPSSVPCRSLDISPIPRNGIATSATSPAAATNASESTAEVPSSVPFLPLGGSPPTPLPPRDDDIAAAAPVPAAGTGNTDMTAALANESQTTNEAPSPDQPSPIQHSPSSIQNNNAAGTPPQTQRNIVDLCSPESAASNAKRSQQTSAAPSSTHQEKANAHKDASQKSLGAIEGTPTDQVSLAVAKKPHPSPIDLTTSPALRPSATSNATGPPAPLDNAQSKCIVYLLQLGRGMPRTRVELLTKTLKQKGGVIIADSFTSQPPPTHIIIDPNVGAVNVASALGFESPEKMAAHFQECNILAVTPQWILSSKGVHENPGLELSWGGLQRFQSAKNAKKNPDGKKRKIPPRKGWMKKARSVDEFAPISVVKASTLRDDDSVGQIVRRRQAGDDEWSSSNDSALGGITNVMRGGIAQNRSTPKRNEALASMFDELASLQKECPLSDMDQWRAYTYNMVAGRLRHLDFEVTPNKDILGSLRGIRGFGQGIMKKIKEFFSTGTCEKLKELKTDPTRVAVRELTNIWGVGPKTASDLVKRGYLNIADIRRGLASGDIDLSDNACIGVDCYEDFLEKMDRSEVKMIGEIVAAAVYKQYPEAEVSTMGSYRRGKAQSGDTDVLVCHPGFVETTPKGSLARILRVLEKDGHIAHHLTLVKSAKDLVDGEGSEMSTYRDSEEGAPGRTVDDTYRASAVSDSLIGGADDFHKSVSWMGVFRSPVEEGKRRRVDIKFYPYREKAFAKLYFTGSGTFNRSMRLWATKSCSMTLNDHGLYKLNVSSHREYYRMKRADKQRSRSERIDCKNEREIFDALNLEYREPCERICFDSVVEKGASKPIALDELSEKDIERECRHRWVD